jgi:hypothetical protein
MLGCDPWCFANRFNHRHQVVGHLFSGRYKAQMVDGSGTGYLRIACDYVHLNPVRAKILIPGQSLREYPWSSYLAYLTKPGERPSWLRVDRLLGEHGIQQDTEAGRQAFADLMETRRRQEIDGLGKIQHGWCLGDKEFKNHLLMRIAGQVREHHAGELRLEVAAAQAEAIMQEEMKRLGWTPADLAQRKKGDGNKMALAWRLRTETTVPIKWIAERLSMGTWKSLNSRLHRWRKNQECSNTMV